ncbi:exonuclease domain-containing protein [Thaumasiovibrio sp. DFM-14]|uniref:exonuclease domain-containing protein n=1 Tax=Thaumasiovibrio sp. DFM-14 TaxID=3384792 RepID=UPI0039A067E7
MNYNRIVCFDLEMCCWNDGREKNTGEIIEVGLAEIDLMKGEIVKRARYFVKPEQDEVSWFCTELTGIRPKVIEKQGRPLESVLRSMVKNFGGNNKIYAAWGRDDLILRDECESKGLTVPFQEYLNLATLFAIKQRVKTPRFGHKAAMDMINLEWEGRQHSGYVDAYNLARLALKIM